MKKVVIYTDGSCKNNPGPGGWAAILMYNGKTREITGAEKNTTNNQMELTAAIKALEILKEPCEVELYSDSNYLVKAFNESWIVKWALLGWKKPKNEELLNAQLWQRLFELSNIHKITWNKVEAHKDNEYNNRCDMLAKAAILKLDL